MLDTAQRRDMYRYVRLVALAALAHLMVGCACGDCTDEDGDGYETCDGDCNDLNPTIYPTALEICNGIDDDCSGLADQNFDRDADGHLETTSCPGVLGADDCDDENGAIFGGAPEICDEIDHNCDGDPYAGAAETSDYCPDIDGDGYPNGPAVSNCGGAGWADCSAAEDCDDNAPAINPGETEVCNGIDDDCDGTPDNGFDADQDGVTTCGADGSIPSADDDCDDLDPLRYYQNPEVCDAVDNDCDTVPDNGFDVDGDTFTSCGADGDAATTADNDCDDGDNSVYPGGAEICDGLDNDCNSQIDDNTVVVEWYPDIDGDTFGDVNGTPVSSCAAPAGHVNNRDDCDDTDAQVSPVGTEVCDGIDNDCVNGIDDPFDADQDGVSDCGGDCDTANGATFPGALELCDGEDNDCDQAIPANETDDDGDLYVECSPYLGAGFLGGDCDDDEILANPGGTELCDGIDNDCVNGVDDGFTDSDADGFAFCPGPSPPPGSDCDDADPANFPGNIEICDGQDNDCDSSTSELTTDGDGDGLAPCDGDCDDTDASLNLDDVDGDTYSSCTGDCNDDTPLVNPGSPEYCDTVDNDCDGDSSLTESDLLTDGDGDGFDGTLCGGTDCDDSDAAVFPVSEYTSGMQRQCRPAVYPGFRHQWHQFMAAQPSYFFDTSTSTHYLYFRGHRASSGPDRAIGVVSSSDGVNWSSVAATPLVGNNASGWDVGNVSSPSVAAFPASQGAARPYVLLYHSTLSTGEIDIGMVTAASPTGPFERIATDGVTPITTAVLPHGTVSGNLDDKFAFGPSVYVFTAGLSASLFTWYSGKTTTNDFNILYATSPDGLTWSKFDTVAAGSPDPLLSQGGTDAFDERKVMFPTVRDNSDPLSNQDFEVWYQGRGSTSGPFNFDQGGVARGGNQVTWAKHELNPCIAKDSTPSRLDGNTTGRLDRYFEEANPGANDGAGTYHIYYASTSLSAGAAYGPEAGNTFSTMGYVAYGVNNAPVLAITSPANNATVTSPVDITVTVTDNAPDTVLLTLLIDDVPQPDVATPTPADSSNFGVQTTDWTFSQVALPSGQTPTIEIVVSDQGGSERRQSIAVTVP